VVPLVAVPVQLLEDPGLGFLDIAAIPDEVDLGVELLGKLPASGLRHDLARHLAVLPTRFSVGGILFQDLLPLTQHPLHQRVAGQPDLDATAHDYLSRVIKQDERQAGMADGLPGKESAGLVQLDRHYLQAFQIIEAQYLLALDKVVSHRLPPFFPIDRIGPIVPPRQ